MQTERDLKDRGYKRFPLSASELTPALARRTGEGGDGRKTVLRESGEGTANSGESKVFSHGTHGAHEIEKQKVIVFRNLRSSAFICG
jgi:hypothetical protein